MQMKEVNREGIFDLSVTVVTSYWSHNIAVCPHSSQLSVYSLCGLVISVEQITKKITYNTHQTSIHKKFHLLYKKIVLLSVSYILFSII